MNYIKNLINYYASVFNLIIHTVWYSKAISNVVYSFINTQSSLTFNCIHHYLGTYIF